MTSWRRALCSSLEPGLPAPPAAQLRPARTTRPTGYLASILTLLLLGACAADCPAYDPTLPLVTYYVSSDSSTTRTEEEYTAPDGQQLGYVAHRHSDPRAALVYLHGIESHAGWFEAAADGLCQQGFDVYCLDRRGSGINRENRGFPSGHVDRWETLVSDIHAFIGPLRERYDRVFLMGLSWGGKLAPVYALEHPEDVEGLVLITPGIVAEVDVSLGAKLGILFGSTLWPRKYYKTPIEPEMFTRTPEYLEKLHADPLRLHCATARFFWESRALDKVLAKRIEENRLPILLFLAGRDRIIDNQAVLELLEEGSQTRLEVVDYEDQTHSIQFDATDRLVHDTTDWVERRLGTRTSP